MLRANPKAVVLTGVLAVLSAFVAVLAYNQLTLQKELADQAKFDVRVMKYDEAVNAKLFPSPTATPTASLNEVRPVVTVKPSLTSK